MTIYYCGTGQAQTTIAQVNALSLVAGDSVLFNRGESWAEILRITWSGVSGNPITFSSYGTGNAPIIQTILVGVSNYSTISNLKISGSAYNGIRIYSGSSNVIVEDCEVTSCALRGISAEDVSDVIIRNNTISLCPSSGINADTSSSNVDIYGNDVTASATDVGEMITVHSDGFNVYDNEVHDNIASHTGAIGIDILRGTNGNVYNNHIHDIDSGGIYIDGGSHVNVYGNLIEDATDGIWCADESGTSPAHDVTIYNNICTSAIATRNSGIVVTDSGSNNDIYDIRYYNNTVTGFLKGISIAGDGHTGIIFKNNVIYNTTNFSINIYQGPPSDLILDYNCYYSSSGNLANWNGTTYSFVQFSNYKTATSQDTHSITSNPLLRSDYGLQAGSPAIDKGVTLPEVPNDYLGVKRPQGAGYDIGAFEWCEGLNFNGVTLDGVVT